MKYFLYNTITVVVTIIALLIGIVLADESPVLSYFAGGLICIFWYQRWCGLRDLKIQNRHPSFEYLNRKMDDFENSCEEYLHALGEDKSRAECNVCGEGYFRFAYLTESTSWCPNLREHYPHRYTDPAPNPNPYKNFWYQWNGYPPPDYFELRSNTLPYVTIMKEKGKEYYMTRPNVVWDLGLVEPPDWYVKRVNSDRSSDVNGTGR